MSSVKVQKINAKNTSTPFIKKICESPKTWLVGDKNTGKAKRDIVIIHRKTDHIYENVDYARNEDFKKKEDNVTLIDVPYDKNESNKLKIVINNFDKILDEYNSIPVASSTPNKNLPSLPTTNKTETKIPKLVKAKTCSIIESKCILKKANSQPLSSNQTKNDLKTKSMYNIHNTEQTFKDFKKDVSNNDMSKDDEKQQTAESAGNVKKIVKRLNSLTDNEQEVSNEKVVSKAKSTMDLTCTKISLASKIPVNTNLRKTYPSIPCDLNSLDSVRCSAGTKKTTLNGKFAKSSQNLTTSKLSLQKSNKNIPTLMNKGKSTQNLSLNGHKTFTKSVQNLNKIVPKNTLTKNSNYKSVQNLASRGLSSCKNNETSTIPKLAKNITNRIDNDNKPSVKPPTGAKGIPRIKTEHNISVSKSIEKLSSIGKTEEVNPDDTFIVIKAAKEKVITVIKQLEENKDTLAKPRLLKTDTFKVTPKSALSKMQSDIKSATFRRKPPDAIKLNYKNTYQFLEKLKLDKTKYELEPDDEIDNLIDYVKREETIHKNNLAMKKDLDYNSDHSDDSGNISNENEIDCEDSHSSSSMKSLESPNATLNIALNQQDSGIDLRQSTNKQRPTKIFFRNGAISQLETQRDERLAGMVVHLQAHCRGYLARKKLAQKKLQDLAVRCIQRNVRKFIAVRDWPWWRLLVRVTPLLNVYRTEEELKIKTNELEGIKQKLEKLENERTKLKHDNDKLEAKLSEMTADLAEEHSTATLAAERLDAETTERLKLEKELSEVQNKNKELQQSSERLEIELLYARSDLNGISEEDEDGDGDGGVYKQRYERAIKELEFTKRRLQQQHEDDLEQLIGLKKQLEKKLADAYEEVEEQRQVVGQWKRKVQKLNGEMNDLKLLLEEQNGRNNLLEKKQRKFDSETQMLQDELKKERQAKDRFAREKEICIAEKYAVESTLADIRLELELKEERLLALQREFDEVTCSGKTEEEVTILRKQKIDCERRLQDQEEELDELAGQVQLLEQAKLRLEMTLESMRKEAKKEAQMRDEELEEVRCNTQKKVKALEQQLENEHEERTLLLREKHELERRLAAAAELERHDRAGDEALLQRLKRDLKRTKALLRDTQAQLERQKSETAGKATIRQLRNQLEDLECARAVAVKTKQSLETDLLETQSLLEEAHKQKQDAEERANALLREKGDLQTQLEENEEELAEVLKKFKGTVQQMSLDQMALQEQASLVSELEIERNHLKEQLAELTTKLESMESMGESSSNLLVRRSELKVKELESKLELEQTTRSRLEVQISRLKEAVEKLQNDVTNAKVKEQQAQDQIRKHQRQLREIKEELNKSLVKESEVIIKKKELEKRCELLEAECSTARTDLRLALKRIEDLQSAIQGELEDTISDNSDSEQETYSSDDSVNKYLSNHKPISPKIEKTSAIDSRRLSNVSRSSTSSNLGKDQSYT